MHRILHWTRYAVILFIFCWGLCVPVGAEEGKPLKVGYYDTKDISQGKSDADEITGYGYEYLQMISNYTGWEYEYVYGSWSEMYDKLLKGELDLMIDVAYTKEREQWMLYPDYIMGTEPYYICVPPGNTVLSGYDLSTFDNIGIGVNANSIQKGYLEDWVSANELQVNIVPYASDSSQREVYFQTGIIDAAVEMGRNIDHSLVPILSLPSSDYYLVVSKERPELLQELNEALKSLEDTMPNLINALRQKHFPNVVVNVRLTEAEKEYLSNHEEIRIGYLKEYLPYSSLEEATGKPIGTVVDIFEIMQEELDFQGTEIRYLPYDTYDDLIAAFWEKEIDVLSTVYTNLWLAERGGFLETNSYASVPMKLIYSGTYEPENIKKIAATKTDAISAYFTASNYREAERMVYPSVEACIEAVYSGEAEAAVANDFDAQYYLKNKSKYRSLSYIDLPEQATLSFGIAKEDIGLLSLLNRGISVIPESAVSSSMALYAAKNQQYTATDFWKDNLWNVVVIVILAALLLALLFILQKNKSRQIELQKLNETNQYIQKQNALLEHALEQAQQAARSKSLFLSNMSHDMRTPMNAIIGFSQLATKRIEDREMVQDYLEKISVSGEHLLELINDVLYMSDMESGNVKLNEEACGLREIIREAEALIRTDIWRKKLHFICKTDEVTHEHIFCDKPKLTQVLGNILSNAVKYTDPYGSIYLTVRQLGEVKQNYSTYEFSIRDTGIGMSEEFVKNIFKPFERASTSTKSGIAGTGLGLTICKNLVEMMQGTITVQSKENVGSEFIVNLTLRCWTPKVISLPEDAEEDQGKEVFAGKRLLLVEDNELNREIAYEILKEVGFLVEEAEDGKIAVEKVREAGEDYFDAVLMDIQMPEMDGYEATKTIRGMKEHEDLPIIALTANALEEDKKKAFEAGMNAHVGKPIDVERFFTALADALKKHQK